ncbi:PREDICTED: uncharacterized protein LOC101301246 [Fragaria vesca subsp. vesca]|uniref:uncharacterized protein LOC101301246 n=1 Tax=Fragaria vesca subsp. vesca TaxID=101020 RepID=UPI0002C35917|nr:PREDICTED: uncharacterized protein LOC101301246 [Fragaria vesca subsp. vesca]
MGKSSSLVSAMSETKKKIMDKYSSMSDEKKKILKRLGIGCGIILIMGVVIGLIVGLRIVPPMVKATVTNASLTQFNLSSNNILYYNLALDVALRSSTGTKVNYKRIKVTAKYKKMFTLGTFTSPPFKQGAKNKTIVLHPNFQGQQFVMLSENDLSVFRSETAAGAYAIDAVVDLKIKPFACRTQGKCLLKVPLSLNHTSASSSFKATQCPMRLVCSKTKGFSKTKTKGFPKQRIHWNT